MIKIILIPILAFTLAASNCNQPSTTNPTAAGQISEADSSQVVVRAEQILRIGKDTFDTFLHLERDNEALVKANFPAIHTLAETIRKNGPDWLQVANDAKNAYKHNRTSGNQIALQNALINVAQNTTKAQAAIEQIKIEQINTSGAKQP